jgi:hypothetical protein
MAIPAPSDSSSSGLCSLFWSAYAFVLYATKLKLQPMAVRDRKTLALSKDFLQRAFGGLLFLMLLFLCGFPMFTPAQVRLNKTVLLLWGGFQDYPPVSSLSQS